MLRDLINEMKAAMRKCKFCDKTAVSSLKGDPVCKGHAKGGSGCK
jgi:hypothetical protein